MSTTDHEGPLGDEVATDDPDELRRQIEETREELGETVAALSDKADVKAQASAKADEVKEKVHEATDAAKAKAGSLTEEAKANPVPFAIGGLFVLLVLNRLRRRRKARRRERGLLEDALHHSLAQGVPVAAVLVDRSATPRSLEAAAG